MMEEKNTIRKYLLETITSVFTFALLGVAVAGWLLDNFMPQEFIHNTESSFVGSFFVVGMGGLHYEGIFQLLGLSVVLAILLLIFMSDRFLSKYMLLWRYLFFLGSALISISMFVLVFGWFPPNVWQGWGVLLATFIVFSSISMIPTFVKIRREDKQYEKALSDYKMKKTEKGDFS